MAEINLNKIAHSYIKNPSSDSDYALKLIDNIWEDGGAYALLGPSGCGKTTLLNIISGLLVPSKGRILFDGKDVTEMPPEKRNIAQVFQFPVLYDTMTVYDNLAFPLRNRKFDQNTVDKRVREIAEVLELTPFLGKKAAGLAADAKQKISLGRGLVRDDVAAILFDEPLTVIDPNLKWQLRCKLKTIHEQLKLTFIYVTHDQVEALTFADKVVVMYDGEIVQIGTPQELFENPTHRFVGYFIGSPGMNFLPCRVEGNKAIVNDVVISIGDDLAELAAKASGKLELGIRPLYLKVHDNEYDDEPTASANNGLNANKLFTKSSENGINGNNSSENRISSSKNGSRIKAKVKALQDQGNFKILTAEMAGFTLRARLSEGQSCNSDYVWLEFPHEWIRLFANERLLQHDKNRR
ncbi:ABC-type sugar transport system, ATP-binding protein [Desulfamplus magnetovallimortis]|uniref:ABC-type sugar transport system, ATP-binding protein n=1 Tax=Desulfamplus magnetovallimortis TaxID=1246637 RepID=A0A1W1HCD7_9BACT|nr:ABC transporter ATP-binding protein [Desulfamplus magnetovallimortis]SLM30096.1 ABC-type sugar transport system, ATP-binding protein [Desulfamplus magnetovallimortis]